MIPQLAVWYIYTVHRISSDGPSLIRLSAITFVQIGSQIGNGTAIVREMNEINMLSIPYSVLFICVLGSRLVVNARHWPLPWRRSTQKAAMGGSTLGFPCVASFRVEIG